MVQYVWSGRGQQSAFHRQLRELFQVGCAVCLDLESPLLGCLVDAKLVGVACVTEPVDKPWPDSLRTKHERFKSVIGAEAARRMEAYEQLIGQYRPQLPNYFLGAIGVHPEAQGKGYGRNLLDAVQALSEAHPTSTGVALSTEKAENVPMYEHCGYRVTAKTNLDQVEVWGMFRPNAMQREE